jgi:hypothetical protein
VPVRSVPHSATTDLPGIRQALAAIGANPLHSGQWRLPRAYGSGTSRNPDYQSRAIRRRQDLFQPDRECLTGKIAFEHQAIQVRVRGGSHPLGIGPRIDQAQNGKPPLVARRA